MELSFIGKPHEIDRKTARKAVKFFATELMTPQMLNNLNIQVKFKKDLIFEGVYGYCDYDDCDPRPRYFTLFIDDNLTAFMTLRTLGHEMVHVRQYATGELKELARKPNRVKWRGKEIHWNEQKWIVDKSDGYPFENEALRLEKKLYKAFKESIDDR